MNNVQFSVKNQHAKSLLYLRLETFIFILIKPQES